MRPFALVIFAAVLVTFVLVAGCTQPPAGQETPSPTTVPPTSVPTTAVPTTPVPPADTIRLVNNPLGNILTDTRGMTLYYYSKDIPGSGASTCTGGCAEIWPVFSAGDVMVSPPLSSSDFTTITRADGSKQTAYKGWPLYYFRNDTVPGDTFGEGVGKVWFVVKPDDSVTIASQGDLGLFLADDTGHTLYFFASDTPGKSVCTSTCIMLWPPFYADPLVIPSILKSSDFTAVTRADGKQQLAYMGRPLYTYTGDKSPGEVNGEGFNDLWYVANITGAVPVPITVPTTTLTTRPTVDTSDSGSSSGSGY
ncbi:putative lipoprotein with Yx(FWY)xxD motif [Methanolinea mesophila]|uniref:hypothetical protein n=1 Tax=Methanolinea mesophila TaxID=547055 RepID=UPI001AE66663|nr:hypothetical protein [Methanolinea mesophila]MBP1930000.1 putative lipoprotein with Yx(FWY)xxD motif [Methanolinea mesophila]